MLIFRIINIMFLFTFKFYSDMPFYTCITQRISFQVCVCVCVCMCVCLSVCVFISLSLSLSLCLSLCVCVCLQRVFVCLRFCIHTSFKQCVCLRSHTCTNSHARTHVRAHTRIRTHTHTLSLSLTRAHAHVQGVDVCFDGMYDDVT